MYYFSLENYQSDILKIWNSEFSEYTLYKKNVGKLFARFLKQSEPFRMISELAVTVHDTHNEVKLSLLKISK